MRPHQTRMLFLAGAAACLVTIGDRAHAQQPTLLPAVEGTNSRLGAGINGASTTIISKEDIERSPQLSLPDILSREAGIQTTTLFGGVNGATSTIDMRGFGITGPSNTLILVNGRRLNDWDLPGFDLSAIARNSIERIEITRGNSGAVLYGDGAVGGVINIVTKSAAGQAPSARIEAGWGSLATHELNASAAASSGPLSVATNGTVLNSGGYRANSNFQQRNGDVDVRYGTDRGSAFFNFAADDQIMGLPGPRRIDRSTGVNELLNDRTGTNFPIDRGQKQGVRFTTGIAAMLGSDVELIVDGGLRRKHQHAEFFGAFAENDVSTTVTTASFTPRVKVNTPLLGMPSAIIAGVDFYDTTYNSDRRMFHNTALIHQFSGSQRTLGGYWQQTVTVVPTTDISFGGRLQSIVTSMRDIYNPLAPQNATFPQGFPLDTQETQHALHAGFEHRFNDAVAVFGRAGRSFRVPNVDERIGNSPLVFPLQPPTFDLRTQTSNDIEAGVKLKFGRVTWQASVYDMMINNELHLSPVNFANVNFDPTGRRGFESIATAAMTDTLRLRGNLTFTEATFREGPFAGKVVPLVSRWTGSAAVSWDILPQALTFDAVLRYVGERFMDNDEANVGRMNIPAYALVDLRLGGARDRLFWSLSVQNVFDQQYFDYGLDTSFTFLGTTFVSHSVFPLPGRTVMAKAGVKF